VDGIHDMGGKQGFGRVRPLTAEPPFAEPWEGKAFALALLSIRAAGANTPAFRYALERVPPADYLASYYHRWLIASQIMLADSGILSAEQVAARAARLSGGDEPEPAAPEPHKPNMPSGGPGNLRTLDTPPAFAVGDRVRTADLHTAGHTRLPGYVRRRAGTVTARRPAAIFPDSAAHFVGEDPQHCYSVEFDSRELWGPEAEPFSLTIDLFEPYLEKTT
jgi:nitrile hydratase subunit beta